MYGSRIKLMRDIFKIIGGILIDVVEIIIMSISIFAVVYLFAFQPHEVSGHSMDGLAGFQTGQYILTDKFTFKLREPKRGEVIVFRYPQNEATDFIKRIIGLPGEQIMVKANKVYIYNEANPKGFVINETEYLAKEVKIHTDKEGQKITIPQDNYFVMGDNRPESSDSRVWGFVPKKNIIGRSFFRYWPLNSMGFIKGAQYDN